MFNIKYYEHTADYYTNFQSNNGEIHLTQSAAFAEFLKSRTVNKNNIFGYKSFVTSLFKEWHHPHTEVYLLSKVKDFLKSELPYESWSYYKKLVREFYLSFVYLVEMGITRLVIDNQTSLTKDQKLLAAMVNTLTKDEYVLNYFKERAILTKQSLSNYTNENQLIEKIYVHHFDYIDAGRMMLFHLFDQIGITVTFVIPYQEDYPELFKTWNSIYQTLPVSKNSWSKVNTKTMSMNGLKLASYLDNKPSEITKHDIRKITFQMYSHPVDFKEYIQTNPILPNQNDLIAIFDENLNRFTSLTSSDSFYSMKYGQLLLSLQKCEKTATGIRFTYDDYVNMMISGWVQSGGIKGEKALSLLIDLRSFLEDAETFSDLMDRLQHLVEFQEMGQVYDDLAKEQVGRNRLKRYLANPFRVFPQMHKSRYSITVKQLIDCTKDLARKLNKLLLEEDEKRNVGEYLQTLNEIYESVNEDWSPEAKQNLEKLFYVSIPEDWSFRSDELHQFLAIYLGKKSYNENKISNFDQLTGKTLISENIHVTGLSFQTFPWKTPDMPSLINHTWIKESINTHYISQNRDRRLNALLVDYYSRKVTRHTALYSLYHLLAYSRGEVTLSYIDGLTEKDGPSIYLSVLEELYGVSNDSGSSNLWEKYDWDEPDFASKNEFSLEVFSKIPDLNWLDSDFCKKKFFFTSFVEHHPVYEQDFHQQQAFATISKLLSEQGDGLEDVRETIYPLFPQWTDSLKDNLIETSKANGLREYKSHENMYYPKALSRVQTLFSRYEVTKNWKALEQYKKGRFKIEKHLDELKQSISTYNVVAQGGHHCRMCPYLTVCKEGEYAIDAND